MTLRPATAADIGFIRSLTTHPDNTPYMGDDDVASLTAYLTDPSARLLIWGSGAPQGFALFREIGNPSGRVELFRLALAQVSGGGGAGFVAALTDYAFATLGAARLWLDASGENARAIRVYERAGFVVEGRLRAHWYRPALGRSVDMVLFAMLRCEWRALRGG